MRKPSIGLYLAWQIAAAETASAKHQYIEKEHMLMGICSLEKVVMLNQDKTVLSPQTLRVLQTENEDVKDVLRSRR